MITALHNLRLDGILYKVQAGIVRYWIFLEGRIRKARTRSGKKDPGQGQDKKERERGQD